MLRAALLAVTLALATLVGPSSPASAGTDEPDGPASDHPLVSAHVRLVP